MCCGYCGDNAACDFKRRHFEEGYDSLRRRVKGEIEMMLSMLPCTAQRKYVQLVKKSLKGLNVQQSAGKGPRLKRKKKFDKGAEGVFQRHVSRDWLVGEGFFFSFLALALLLFCRVP